MATPLSSRREQRIHKLSCCRPEQCIPKLFYGNVYCPLTCHIISPPLVIASVSNHMPSVPWPTCLTLFAPAASAHCHRPRTTTVHPTRRHRWPRPSRLRLHATRCSATATHPVRTENEFRVLIDFLDSSLDFEKNLSLTSLHLTFPPTHRLCLPDYSKSVYPSTLSTTSPLPDQHAF